MKKGTRVVATRDISATFWRLNDKGIADFDIPTGTLGTVVEEKWINCPSIQWDLNGAYDSYHNGFDGISPLTPRLYVKAKRKGATDEKE